MNFGSFLSNLRNNNNYNSFISSQPGLAAIQAGFDLLGGFIFRELPRQIPYDPPISNSGFEASPGGSCECQKYYVEVTGSITETGNFRLDGRQFNEIITDEIPFGPFEFGPYDGPILGLTIKPENDASFDRGRYYLSVSNCGFIDGSLIPVSTSEIPLSLYRFINFKNNDPDDRYYFASGNYSISGLRKAPPIRADCDEGGPKNPKAPRPRSPKNRFPGPGSRPPAPKAPGSNAPPAPNREPIGPPGLRGPGNKSPNGGGSSSKEDFFDGGGSGSGGRNRPEILPPPPGAAPRNPRDFDRDPEPKNKRPEEKPENKEREIDKKSKEILEKLCARLQSNLNLINSKEPKKLGQYFDFEESSYSINNEGLLGIFEGLLGLSEQLNLAHKDILKSMRQLYSPSQFLPKICSSQEEKDADENSTKPEGNLEEFQENNINKASKAIEIDLEENNLFIFEKEDKYLPEFLILKQQEQEIFAQGINQESDCNSNLDIVGFYAEDAIVYPNSQSYLYLVWMDASIYPNRRPKDPIWQVRIPRPRSDLNWQKDLKDLRWKRGAQHAVMHFEGVRNRVAGYFFNKEEANKYFDKILLLTELKEKEKGGRKYQDTNAAKKAPLELTTRIYRAYLAYLDDKNQPQVTKVFGEYPLN